MAGLSNTTRSSTLPDATTWDYVHMRATLIARSQGRSFLPPPKRRAEQQGPRCESMCTLWLTKSATVDIASRRRRIDSRPLELQPLPWLLPVRVHRNRRMASPRSHPVPAPVPLMRRRSHLVTQSLGYRNLSHWLLLARSTRPKVITVVASGEPSNVPTARLRSAWNTTRKKPDAGSGRFLRFLVTGCSHITST